MSESKEHLSTLDLPLSGFVPRRYRPGNIGTWSGHLNFANDLIAAVRPSLIVELGTHYGESYFTFCQSIAENGIACRCYAVDHWRGEEHSEYYGEQVIREVAQYNDTNYSSFSYLLRTTFDEANSQFADGSIDLLHIDGLHTFEAVRHDFYTWLPKVRPGGIILLHDIAVRHADFGVWRLWDELAAQFCESFAFYHSWGLGVLRKPGGEVECPNFLRLLFDSPLARLERVRRHYSMYATYLDHLLQPEQSEGTRTKVQIFRPEGGQYSEQESSTQQIETGAWQALEFQLPKGSGSGPLRIDPADCPCVIELGEISVTNDEMSGRLWSANTPSALRKLGFSNTVTLLPARDKCLLFSFGDDPQVLLPAFAQQNHPLRVKISLKVDRNLNAVSEALTGVHDAELVSLRAELRTAQAEVMLSAAELSQVAAERNEARRELARAEQLAENACVRSSKSDDLTKSLETELESIKQSLSWRATAPVRNFVNLLRRFRSTD